MLVSIPRPRVRAVANTGHHPGAAYASATGLKAIERAYGIRGMGDALEDELAGPDSDGLVVKSSPQLTDGLMTPTWASSSTSAPPANPVKQGNNSSDWSWSDLGKTLVAGITQGLVAPKPATYKPATITSAPSSFPTGAVIAGVGGLALLVLLMRRRDA